MAAIQRTLHLEVNHFEIGDYVQYGWFRGELIGINYAQLQQTVRVQEVIRSAPGRSVGSIQRIPFNMGEIIARPSERNRNS